MSGYRIYYGTTSGNYNQARGFGVNAGRTTSFTVTGLQSGQRYYFAVSAYDAAGNESTLSAEASKVVP